MSRKFNSRTALAAVLATAAAFATGPAAAGDASFDPSQPLTGPTLGAPSEAARDILRRAEKVPTLTERFGLPSISGPLPPILPPARGMPAFERIDEAPPR
ncbi:MAG: hypothetical protein KIT16_03040 [Rhodospirillaceae bacterium]|nr:hypothetical protein [Rhodospirillaceae bacterium]